MLELIWIGFFGLVILFVLAVSILRPGAALALVLSGYALEQLLQAYSASFATYQFLVNAAVGVVVLMSILIHFIKRHPIYRDYPAAGWLTLILLGYAMASYIWAEDPGQVLLRMKIWAPYIVLFILLTPLCIYDPADLRAGLLTTLAVGVPILVMILTVPQEGRQLQLQAATNDVAVSASGNPLAIGEVGGTVAIIAVLLNLQHAGKLKQWLRWLVVAVALLVVVRSGSRGQFLAVFLACALLMPMSRKIKDIGNFVVAAVGTFIMSIFGYLLVLLMTEGNRWNLDAMIEDYTQTRAGEAGHLLEYWMDGSPGYWLVGLGSSGSYSVIGFYPHIVPLEILAEEGLIGLGLFIAIIVVTFQSILRVKRQLVDDDYWRGLFAALVGLFIFYLILTFKQGCMLSSQSFFAVAIMIGRFEHGLNRYWREHPDLSVGTDLSEPSEAY